jgi:hypothetical protein
MAGLKVLITNFMFATRSGTEVYVRDLALALLKRGHTPIVYSPRLGEIARETRVATIPVVDDLNTIGSPPDIIHGHHHNETMTALLHFPGVPAVYACHDWFNELDSPPSFPRILRYIAIDQTCYDKLVYEYAVPEERVRLLLNSVDLERFKPRPPLPARPERALVYCRYVEDDEYLQAVREACKRTGLAFDAIGQRVGAACTQPEKVIGQYDIVFAKARSALEALAVGSAVIVHCMKSAGPMVTTSNLEQLLPLNFGIRAMNYCPKPEMLQQEIIREISHYDAGNAAEVSLRVREQAGGDASVAEIISLYEEVIAEHKTTGGHDAVAESRAAAAYVRWLSSRSQEHLTELNNSSALRLKRRLVEIPLLGKLSHALARRLAGSRASDR